MCSSSGGQNCITRPLVSLHLKFISCLYMFRAHVLIIRKSKLHYTASGITRGCVMQFWPPDDEHMCSKHVEAWNKTYCKTKILCIKLANYWYKVRFICFRRVDLFREMYLPIESEISLHPTFTMHGHKILGKSPKIQKSFIYFPLSPPKTKLL